MEPERIMDEVLKKLEKEGSCQKFSLLPESLSNKNGYDFFINRMLDERLMDVFGFNCYISSKGKIINKNGGYLKYCEKKAKRELRKQFYDYWLSKLKFTSMTIQIIGLIINVILWLIYLFI